LPRSTHLIAKHVCSSVVLDDQAHSLTTTHTTLYVFGEEHVMFKPF